MALPNKSNYYADAEPTPGPPDKATQDPKQKEEERGEDQTAEVPKSVFGSKIPQPGDRCEFEAVQVMEDSVLIKYAQHEEEPPEEETQPAQGGGEEFGASAAAGAGPQPGM